jgi:hypothetical protein
MNGNRLVRKIRDWMPKGRRNLVRQKMKWKDMVKHEDWINAKIYKV